MPKLVTQNIAWWKQYLSKKSFFPEKNNIHISEILSYPFIKITDKIAVSLKDITLDDVIRESVNIYTPTREESIKIISMVNL